MKNLIMKLLSLVLPYHGPSGYHNCLALHMRDAGGRSALDP